MYSPTIVLQHIAAPTYFKHLLKHFLYISLTYVWSTWLLGDQHCHYWHPGGGGGGRHRLWSDVSTICTPLPSLVLPNNNCAFSKKALAFLFHSKSLQSISRGLTDWLLGLPSGLKHLQLSTQINIFSMKTWVVKHKEGWGENKNERRGRRRQKVK